VAATDGAVSGAVDEVEFAVDVEEEAAVVVVVVVVATCATLLLARREWLC